MDSHEAQSPQNQELARQRREEAARLQQINLKQQAIKIEQQRLLAERQKQAGATAGSAPAKPAVARSVFTPAPASATAKPVIGRSVYISPPKQAFPKTEIAPAPPAPAQPNVPEANLPPRGDPTASATKQDLEEMRAELADFASASTMNDPDEPMAVDDIEIVATPPQDEIPPLKLLGKEDSKKYEGASLPDEDIEVIAASPPDAEIPALKMLTTPDLHCPKCGILIRAEQRGAFYTECRKCGEIIKSNAT